MSKAPRLCSRCVLPESFPGIRFNRRGVCTYCQAFQRDRPGQQDASHYLRKFGRLARSLRGQHHHEALLCYSGGKDSTYTLALLKERYGLSVLAVTFDNGFIPEMAFQNIRQVTEALDVDHIFIRPQPSTLHTVFRCCAQHSVFPSSYLERASSICTACMGMVKFTALRLAIERDIPLLVFGWSPGQAPLASALFRHTGSMLAMTQKVLLGRLEKHAGSSVRQFLIPQELLEQKALPYNVNPLLFQEYDESGIYRRIRRYGWTPPQGTDANSTNCLLNAFANHLHAKKLRYHPYAYEMANLVRQGHCRREDALHKLNTSGPAHTIRMVKSKLGLA